MIFEILTERSDGTPFAKPGVIFREISGSRIDAYDCKGLLETAGLDANVFVCNAGGYENALFFERLV